MDTSNQIETNIEYNSITAKPHYNNMSFEELRCQYNVNMLSTNPFTKANTNMLSQQNSLLKPNPIPFPQQTTTNPFIKPPNTNMFSQQTNANPFIKPPNTNMFSQNLLLKPNSNMFPQNLLLKPNSNMFSENTLLKPNSNMFPQQTNANPFIKPSNINMFPQNLLLKPNTNMFPQQTLLKPNTITNYFPQKIQTLTPNINIEQSNEQSKEQSNEQSKEQSDESEMFIPTMDYYYTPTYRPIRRVQPPRTKKKPVRYNPYTSIQSNKYTWRTLNYDNMHMPLITYTPPLEQIEMKKDVDNFKITHRDFGSIEFLQPINISDIDFNMITFKQGKIHIDIPKLINIPARISLFNINISIDKLQKFCIKQNSTFVSYSDNIWTFDIIIS